jgi:hypothetical protein
VAAGQKERERECDALGFHQGLLTLTIWSNTLTLVKQWSTWASPRKARLQLLKVNIWSNLGQTLSNPSQNPTQTL